ncbi:uncharacterized protein LOC126375875 [Pectinophora gossypiella]|uniref:uncharacterized protein LOC126375875 n=1 Tax=Pectinophora gossypiella TaxID=13191 RepID=UPI00214DF97C|nr:uncharacterized protein LOC126375875 [Pectinophora gossypiella]
MAGDEVVKDLVKKRGSFKGRLTGFINFCTELSKKELTSSDARELQLRLSKLQSLYDQYDEVQLQIECLVLEPEPQYTARTEFDSQYYRALADAEEMLSTFNKANEPPAPAGSDKSTHTSNRNQLVKLPTIQLPKFNGVYESWLEFRDTFTSLVHSNDDIDAINKFHYLRACLEGSAAVVINSIEFSASNYSVAWKLLCERFDNKRLLIHNHVAALFNIENVKESSAHLKRLIDQLNKNIRALKSLGESVEHWDTLLIYIVTQKLDLKTFREWEEYKGRLEEDDPITFKKFIKFIRNRADLIETLEMSRSGPASTCNKSNPKLKSMVGVQNTSNAQLSSKVCPKCKGNHTLTDCSSFLALSNEERLKLVPTFKICYNCLTAGHFANRCRKQGCKICKRRHNTLLHTTEYKSIANAHNENVHLPYNEPSTSSRTLSSGN